MSTVKKKRSLWSNESLTSAVAAVKTGRLSSYKAASLYNIPRRTLRDYLKNEMPKQKLGRKSVLTKAQEDDFVKRIIRYSELGIPLTSKMIRKQVFVFCEINNIANKFNKKAGLAGKDWLKLFLQRNPAVTKRKAQFLNSARAQKLNKVIVAQHFTEVKKLYDELGLHYNPERIYNMDEKGCRLTIHKQPTVIAEKGAKRVHIQASEHGENVTIVGCANALGNAIPPMVIFKGIRKKPEFEENLPTGAIVRMAPKGSMTTELFIDFLNHFAKFKSTGNCLLIFDGAKSHLDFRIVEEADKLNITLYCLPSNTTHELQPLDKACYKPFESFWDQEAMQHFYESRAQKLTKSTFNKILSKVWSKCMTLTNITSGFQATGLYPLNSSVIPESAYAPSILTEHHTSPNRDNSGGSCPLIGDSELQALVTAQQFTPPRDDDATPDLSPFATPNQVPTDQQPTTPQRPKFISITNSTDVSPIPTTSGLQSRQQLVDYSSSTESSESGIMNKFVSRPRLQKRVRIYSSSDSDTKENKDFVPSLLSQPEANAEEDLPLGHFSKKSSFHKFMPTPNYAVAKNKPRQKALNYKGQRVTKDLFNDPKDTKRKAAKTGKKAETTKKQEKSSKTVSKKNETVNRTGKKTKTKKEDKDQARWYCHACKEERIVDMRQCTNCVKWYHDECIGLTINDDEQFTCPDGCD